MKIYNIYNLITLFVLFFINSSSFSQDYEILLEGLDFPSMFLVSQDFKNTVFIAEHQTGLIKKINLTSKKSEVIINIGDRINVEDWEAGLNSFVLSPDYINDQIIYVNYVDPNGDIIISKFLSSENNSEKIILKITRRNETRSHHCGYMLFDQRNYLNICVGDLNNNENPYNLNSLSGKILRINVINEETYSIPKENPYISYSEIRDEILFYGFRNPWKFSIYNNNFYIPDVGNNSWEELNIIENYNSLKNYMNGFGWPYFEGYKKTKNYSLNDNSSSNLIQKENRININNTHEPILVYPHNYEEHIGCSIIGGEVYDGELFQDWKGTYLFSDICSGKIWALKKINNKYKIIEIADLDIQPVSIGKDLNNEIIILTLGGELLKFKFPKFDDYFVDSNFYFLGLVENLHKTRIQEVSNKYENSFRYRIGDKIINFLRFFRIDRLFVNCNSSNVSFEYKSRNCN